MITQRLWLSAWVASCAVAFLLGREWRDRSAEVEVSRSREARTAEMLQAETRRGNIQREQAQTQQRAADKAEQQKERVNAEYIERLEAAVAGRDGELGRLRKLWASDATQCLSSSSAAAAALAEQDRLRRASAARVLRAVELVQIERNEVVDRYEALMIPEASLP